MFQLFHLYRSMDDSSTSYTRKSSASVQIRVCYKGVVKIESRSCFNMKNGHHLRIVVVVVALLFYVHGKHLRSCRDGQLT